VHIKNLNVWRKKENQGAREKTNLIGASRCLAKDWRKKESWTDLLLGDSVVNLRLVEVYGFGGSRNKRHGVRTENEENRSVNAAFDDRLKIT